VLSAPWALLAYALIANGAPEGGVASTIWLTSFGILNIFVIAFLSRYVLPHISKLFTGRKSESFDSTPRFDPPGLTPATDAAGPGATL
jgi:Kef-type K+ transport system membrane component KefB